MLTKAFVSDVMSPHSVRVRIPLINKIDSVQGSTPATELSIAAVCTVPNFITNLTPGDIVIVGFEEDDTAHPIILGYLSTSKELNSKVDIICGKFKATEDVALSKKVTIGEISYENISTLKGQKDNIKQKFTTITNDVSTLKTDVKLLKNNVKTNTSNIGTLTTDLEELQHLLSNLETRIASLEGEIKDLPSKFDNYLTKNPTTILSTASYGTSVPSTGTEGQIYLHIQEDD